MSDFSLDDLKKAFTEALNESGRSSSLAGASADRLKENLSKLDKEIANSRKTIGSYAKDMLMGRKNFKDLSVTLSDLDKKLDDLKDTADESEIELRGELIKRREAIHLIAQQNAGQRAVIAGLTTLSGKLTTAAGQTMGGFVKGLQNGSSAFALAGGLMEGAIDGMNAGAQTVSAGLNTVGQTAMTSTNPRLKALGVAATVTSIGISKLGDASAGLAKFVVGYMVKEMEKTVDAFNQTTAAGAMFADGMSGMRNNAHEAGLTVKQFGDVISKNSELFGQSGVGVAEGAKQIGRVGKVLRDTGMTDQMLKLGYGFEEQAALIAETTANMRRTAGGTVSDKEVAQQTAKYAENLRIIAGITGEDAKKKVEQARQENQILAFQQELAKKTPEQRAQIDAAMATMTEQEKKNFRERVVLGNVINTEGAIYEATIKGAREKGEAALALFNTNKLTAESNAELNAQYGAQIRASALQQQGIAIAGMVLGDVAGGTSKAMLDAVNQANTYTVDAKSAAKAALDGQKNATDKFTEDTIRAAKAAQNMAILLEEKTMSSLENFTKYTNIILTELDRQLRALNLDGIGGSGSTPSGPSFWQQAKGNMITGALGGATVGALAAPATLGTSSLVGGAIGAGGGLIQTLIERDSLGLFGGSKASGSRASLSVVRDLIASVESQGAGGYNATVGMGQKDLTNMTISQIFDLQKSGAGAVGRYQFIRSTLHEMVNALGLDPRTTKFTPDIQDKLADELIKRQGYQSYASGAMAKDDFLRKLSTQWAGLPGSPSGESYWAGTGNNKAHIGWDAALSKLAKGGVTNGPSIAGEAGAEAVVPLPDGRTIPARIDGLGDLIEKFDEMIRILKDQLDVSEKHLRADT